METSILDSVNYSFSFYAFTELDQTEDKIQ